MNPPPAANKLNYKGNNVNVKLVLYLKLLRKATVGVRFLLLVVKLVVLRPHLHTPAQTCSTGQTVIVLFILPRCSCAKLDRCDHSV